MSTTQQHALRSRWFFFYLPLITPDMVSASYNGDWKVAAEELTQHLDWVSTVEELWSSINSLPKIQSLPVGSTYILSRDGKEASFENFPSGSRLLVNLQKSPATDAGLDTILAAVLGESITSDVGLTDPVCDVVRIAARPNREFMDLLRVEVWLNDAAYSAKVTSALRKALKERGITSSSYDIKENPFEGAVKKMVGSPSSPELEKSRSTTEQAPKAAEPEAASAPAAAAPEEAAKAEPEQETAPQEAAPEAAPESGAGADEEKEEEEASAKDEHLEKPDENAEESKNADAVEAVEEQATSA